MGLSKRVFVSVSPRSGSAFLCSLLMGIPGTYEDWNKVLSYPVWMKTIPEKTHRFFMESPQATRERAKLEIPADITDVHLRTFHIGCQAKIFQQLPEADWRFLYLLRDPRNRNRVTSSNVCKKTWRKMGPDFCQAL